MPKRRNVKKRHRKSYYLRDTARTRSPGASVDSGAGRLQLNILTEGDDIEVYLTTFERLMLARCQESVELQAGTEFDWKSTVRLP